MVASYWKTAKGSRRYSLERHLEATLTCMDDSNYVELEDTSGAVCAFHVNFFGLKYNGNGSCKTTNRRPPTAMQYLNESGL
jgi:hypothetical protein